MVIAVETRGEVTGAFHNFRQHAGKRPPMKEKTMNSSGVVMKILPQPVTRTQSAPVTLSDQESRNATSGGENEKSEFKKNNPKLSPSLSQSPRRPTSIKQPISDISAPNDLGCKVTGGPCLSPFEHSIITNVPPLLGKTTQKSMRTALQLAERSQSMDFTSHSLPASGCKWARRALRDENVGADSSRAPKRVCSGESKENIAELKGEGNKISIPAVVGGTVKVGVISLRTASALASQGNGSGKKKSRAGLRLL